ncbi:MAG: ABC transporter permease [Armatimonadetes bacterium]|nr:ABC transporter permease [Armatimonadota bacterium]
MLKAEGRMPSVEDSRRRSRAAIVFTKEFREVFRDRRTIIGVVISPLLITPLLFLILGTFIAGEAKKMEKETMSVGVVNANLAPSVMKAIGKPPSLAFERVQADRAESLIKSRKLRAALVLPTDAEKRLAAHRAVRVQVMLDAGNEKSNAAAARLRAAVTTAGAGLIQVRLKRLDLPSDFATPFDIKEAPIKTGTGRGTLIVAGMLPYLLALSCFSSGIYAANDTVAGEKERGTLETLLVSPASRREIVLGKFLAVAALCCVGSVLSVVGMSIPFFSGLKAFDWIARGGMHLTAAGIGVTLLMQIPLAVLFAGMLMIVSTFARNQKEAQTYLGPMMIAIIVPAMMSMVMGAEAPRAMAAVPVLNASLIIKQALTGSTDPAFLVLALAASVLYAGIAVAICTRLFDRENVLLRT